MELVNFCEKVARSSSLLEITNTDFKKEYLKMHVDKFNQLAKDAGAVFGTFGTGYPFYALESNFEGSLPVIREQIRYNQELVEHALKSTKGIWVCENCLARNYASMVDLKGVCKPCPRMDDELKPRKVINRLLDIDLWAITDKDELAGIKERLTRLFTSNNFVPSDIDPIDSIERTTRIALDIHNGVMPNDYLPLDAHLIDYDELYNLIEETPDELKSAYRTGRNAYLPIHPISYRKDWQYDDVAYNFVTDYLLSFTGFNLDPYMSQLLANTRKDIANSFTPNELYNMLYQALPDSGKRRIKESSVKNLVKKRVLEWK